MRTARGYTLIETMIAIALALMVLTYGASLAMSGRAQSKAQQLTTDLTTLAAVVDRTWGDADNYADLVAADIAPLLPVSMRGDDDTLRSVYGALSVAPTTYAGLDPAAAWQVSFAVPDAQTCLSVLQFLVGSWDEVRLNGDILAHRPDPAPGPHALAEACNISAGAEDWAIVVKRL